MVASATMSVRGCVSPPGAGAGGSINAGVFCGWITGVAFVAISNLDFSAITAAETCGAGVGVGAVGGTIAGSLSGSETATGFSRTIVVTEDREVGAGSGLAT